MEALTPKHATAMARVTQLTAEIAVEREHTQATRSRLDAITPELATLKARAESHAAAQAAATQTYSQSERRLRIHQLRAVRP